MDFVETLGLLNWWQEGPFSRLNSEQMSSKLIFNEAAIRPHWTPRERDCQAKYSSLVILIKRDHWGNVNNFHYQVPA